jgi:hypothetical protein
LEQARFLGLGLLALVLCAPALGVGRSFGVTLPALAFFTAIAIAVVTAFERLAGASAVSHGPWGRLGRAAVAGILLLGMTIGVAGGVRRSLYVAEALHEHSVTRVLRDGQFLFDTFSTPVTVPAGRRQEKLARLAGFGIRSRADLERLENLLDDDKSPYAARRTERLPLFLEKYDYLSF